MAAAGTASAAMCAGPLLCVKPPSAPPPTYLVDAQPLTIVPDQVEPFPAFDSTLYVDTKVHIRYQVQRSNGAVLAAWVVSDYHVWNEQPFTGWQVAVNAYLFDAGSALRAFTTQTLTIAVAGALVPDASSATAETVTPIPVATAQRVAEFQAVNMFSALGDIPPGRALL